MPRIEQNRVKYFLDKCDILYLSTEQSKRWEYGQSMNKLVDYMLSAKPIIASYSGYPSMVNEAHCGEFIKTTKPIDIKNALLDMVAMDSSKRDKLGQNGKKWIYANRQYKTLAKNYIDKIIKLKNA